MIPLLHDYEPERGLRSGFFSLRTFQKLGRPTHSGAHHYTGLIPARRAASYTCRWILLKISWNDADP